MLLVGNGTVITRDPNTPLITNGAVYMENDTLIEVGDTRTLRAKYPHAKWLDAKSGLIMPGFINTHNHIYSAFARGLNLEGPAPLNFLQILEQMWWHIDRHLSLEDIIYSAYWTLIDGIKNGVTTVFDHHASYGHIEGSLFAIAEVAETLGLRTCLCYEISDRDGTDKMKAAVKENVDFMTAYKADTYHTGMMGLHAAFTLSDETLSYCQSHIPNDHGYHIHVAEGINDLYDSLRHHGKRTINRLHDLGILGPRTIAAHCIHINPEEMCLLKETDTMVVHNPESNMGNAVGCPPVLELFHRDILIGLGTDGYTNDMLESLKVAHLLHKHHLCNPSVAWGEIPSMLFENNAAIVNRFFNTPIGVLRPGAAADVIIADYVPQTPLTAANSNAHILFGLNGHSITTTIARGRVLMANREIVVADEMALMARARELATALWKRL